MIKNIEESFLNIQSNIIDIFSSLEDENKAEISLDKWSRDEGGGGGTSVVGAYNLYIIYPSNCDSQFSLDSCRREEFWISQL